MQEFLPFADRQEAGALLAEELRAYQRRQDVLVCALVRGGVVIGRAMADALQVPLRPFIVRKIGHPAHREYALGAIAEGGGTYLDDTALRLAGLAWEDIEEVIEEEMEEMRRRKALYSPAPLPDLSNMTVILTDDGAATGSTMIAAIRDLRKKAKTVVVALPVCPRDTAAQLRRKADAVFVLATPEPFHAVGEWYLDFPQVEDDEVLTLLRQEPQHH